MYRFTATTVCSAACAGALGLALSAVQATAQAGSLSVPVVTADGQLDPAWEIDAIRGEADIGTSAEGVLLRCDAASFSVNRKLDVRANDFTSVAWTWRADVLPVGGDVRVESRNDQALQLLLTFDRWGFGYRAISYVWDTTAPVGTTARESYGRRPFYKVDIAVIVVQSGERSGPEPVSRDFAADYRAAYGEDPGRLVAVRLQTNCQHTNSSAQGSFGPLITLES